MQEVATHQIETEKIKRFCSTFNQACELIGSHRIERMNKKFSHTCRPSNWERIKKSEQIPANIKLSCKWRPIEEEKQYKNPMMECPVLHLPCEQDSIKLNKLLIPPMLQLVINRTPMKGKEEVAKLNKLLISPMLPPRHMLPPFLYIKKLNSQNKELSDASLKFCLPAGRGHSASQQNQENSARQRRKERERGEEERK